MELEQKYRIRFWTRIEHSGYQKVVRLASFPQVLSDHSMHAVSMPFYYDALSFSVWLLCIAENKGCFQALCGHNMEDLAVLLQVMHRWLE